MDRGVWGATVHAAATSLTQLKGLGTRTVCEVGSFRLTPGSWLPSLHIQLLIVFPVTSETVFCRYL